MKKDFSHRMCAQTEEDIEFRQGRSREKWESTVQFQYYTILYGGGAMVILLLLTKLGII